jgi:hypothetical protein
MQRTGSIVLLSSGRQNCSIRFNGDFRAEVAFDRRRFTRLTNGFSKKLTNHAAAIALHYMHYYFCRIHKTLRVTPAMEAGITDRVWSSEDIALLLEAATKKKSA